VLSVLADYAAIAIDNARLYELMEQRAQELTHLLTSQSQGEKGREQELSHRTRLLDARETRLLEEREPIIDIAEELGNLYLQLKAVGARITGSHDENDE